MNSSAPLLGAIVLICLGSLFAASDAALNTVSMARVQELVRDERPGAVRLAKVMADRPRYVNLVVLLRIICELRYSGVSVAYALGAIASYGLGRRAIALPLPWEAIGKAKCLVDLFDRRDDVLDFSKIGANEAGRGSFSSGSRGIGCLQPRALRRHARLERRAIWTAPLPGFAARRVHFSAARCSIDPEPRPFGY